MNRLLRLVVLMVFIFSILMIAVNIHQGVELHHLESENAKFKHEIEYLRDSNESLQEDNRDIQDRIWNLYNNEMKEGK